MNPQESRYLLAENPRPILEVLLCGTEDGVWCALKATRIIQSTLFSDTENSEAAADKLWHHFSKFK
jgi:hypothetical protein